MRNTSPSLPVRGNIATSSSVFKNTLLLLGASFLFSALTGYYAYLTRAQMGGLGLILFFVVAFALPYIAKRLKNSRWGIAIVFTYTGFLGYFAGMTVNAYLTTLPNGAQVVTTAMGATAVIFFALSAFALISKKDFSYLGATLFVGFMIAFMAGIGAIIFKLPLLQVAVSGAFALISSGYILFTLSNIIHNREDSSIMATMILFASLFNLFISLLNILSFFSGGGRR